MEIGTHTADALAEALWKWNRDHGGVDSPYESLEEVSKKDLTQLAVTLLSVADHAEKAALDSLRSDMMNALGATAVSEATRHDSRSRCLAWARSWEK